MWCKKSPSPWILDQGSLLFTTNYVELWTTLKLSSSWTLSALKLLWSLIRYSTIKILLKKKKVAFGHSFGFWLFPAHLQEHGCLPAQLLHCLELEVEILSLWTTAQRSRPKPCSAAAVLLEDAAKLELQCGGFLSGGDWMWDLVVMKLAPFIICIQPFQLYNHKSLFCALPPRPNVAKP